MKLLLLIGGLIGFAIGAGLGLVREQSMSTALVHACVAIYIGAVLMRWWGRVWIKALREAQEDPDVMTESVIHCPETARPGSRELRERYHAAPGSAAEGELVREHLPLVKTVVGRLAMTLPSHVDLDDLHSAGVIGLLNALRNFDESNGARFETYARIRIHGAVIDELRRMDCVSRTIRDKARKVRAVIAQLEQQNGKPPTEDEIARHMNLSLADYQALLDEIRPVTFVCLDAVIGVEDSDGSEQYETVVDTAQESPVETASKRELSRLVEIRIQQLPIMQRKVLALYYFEGLRLREIAEAFGVTESRICQIHSQAILSIKAWLRNQEAGEPI